MSRIIEDQVVEWINDPERNRLHIKEIDLITGGRLKDRVLHNTCSPIQGFLQVERSESDQAVELIPFSAIMRLVIDENELSKANLKFALSGR